MKRDQKRAQLVEIAMKLFDRYGYHATGVDRIIAESGIAKTTLYRHFPSKEDLIVTCLAKRDERFRDEMRECVEATGHDPRERLLATFDYLQTWFDSPAFHGCPFVCAAGEYCEQNHPVFQQAILHKRLVIAYFEELAHAAGFTDAKNVAREINLLHEGAVAAAQVLGHEGVAAHAKQTARRLLAA